MDKIIEKKTWSAKKLILPMLICITIIALFSFYRGTSGSSFNIDKNRISIATVKYADFIEYIPIDGTVQPIKTVMLDAIEGGRVEYKYIEDGAMVKAGQPILKFSNSQLSLDLMNREELLQNEKTILNNSVFAKDKNLLAIKEQIIETEYNLEKTKRKFLQDSIFIQDKIISENEFAQSKEEYYYLLKKKEILKQKLIVENANSESQILEYNKSVKLKEKNLYLVRENNEKLTLLAPVSGQITSLKAELGEFKNKGQNLGQIDILDGFKIRASIDEHYITRVSIAQLANFNLNGVNYQLAVKKIYPQVSNGRFEADLEFVSNTIPSELKRGQSVQLKLELSNSTKSLLIERGGFYQSTGGNWVFVVNKNTNKAEKRQIKLGRQNSEYYEIKEGLRENEKVITSSYETFGNNETLTIK